MSECVNRKVFPHGWGGNLGAPVKGEVNGGEASCKVSGRVLSSEGGKGGERRWESSRSWVGVGGGAGHPKGGQSSSVPAVRNDWGEACFACQDRGGGGVKVVGYPSLDPVPETVHASERSVGRGKEVGAIREYGAEETGGDAMA